MALIRCNKPGTTVTFESFRSTTVSDLSSTGISAVVGHKYLIFGYNTQSGAPTGSAVSGCTLDQTLSASTATKEFVVTATATTLKFNITGGTIAHVYVTEIGV